MKLTANGVEYSVHFSHPSDSDSWCFISEVNRTGEKPEYRQVASASVHRYYKDPPNREKARRAALTAAIRRFDRTQRREFWTVYLESKKKKPAKEDN